MSTATLNFAVPVAAGSYEFRFFAAGGYTRLATSTAIVVAAPSAQVDVNGVSAPASADVAAGSVAVASMSGGPANPGDWVALYPAGAPDGAHVDWRYLNDTAVQPGSGVATAALHFTMPSTPGSYEFRFFADNGYGRLATSGAVIVLPTPAQIFVNGTLPPAVVSTAPGATVTVQIASGPGNAADWVALAETGTANGLFVGWQYLNGQATPPTAGLTDATLTFVMPPSPGTYELRLFVDGGLDRLATSASLASSTTPPDVTVALTNPFPGTNFVTPTNLLIQATATVTNGTIGKVDFFAGPTLIGSSAASPHQALWSTPPIGLHTLTAVVTDNTGAVTTSTPVTVSITEGGTGFGTLGPPIATPPPGLYGPNQPVTLTAAPGATIRFTTDGSTPTASSPVFTAPFVLAGSAVLQSMAFSDGWSASPVAVAAYEIDLAPPVVSAVVQPQPNLAGWNNTPVTVSFVCSDRSEVTCPEAITVAAGGAGQLVSATATDIWGHQASASATLNLDFTAPTLTLESPSSGTSTSLSSVLVTAHAADAFSGLLSAQCNGADASIANGTITCDAPLRPGINTVGVYAVDHAGNSVSRAVRVTRITSPNQLVVTPKRRTVRTGETVVLKATSETGAELEGITWGTSDAGIVSVDMSNGLGIVAVAPGQATITATLGGLSAQVTITVLPDGTSWTAGESRWNVEPTATPDTMMYPMTVYAHRNTSAGPDFFAFEGAWGVPETLRAFAADGTELWREALPGRVYPWYLGGAPFGDHQGAVVVPLVGDDSGVHALARVGVEGDVLPWRHEIQGFLVGSPAQAPDGTIYYTEVVSGSDPLKYDGFVVGVDGATGAVKFRVSLPSSGGEEILTGSCSTYPNTPENTRFPINSPLVVGPDGAAYFQVLEQHSQWRPVCDTNYFPAYPVPGMGTRTMSEKLQLMRVDSNGAVSLQLMSQAQRSRSDALTFVNTQVVTIANGPSAVFDEDGGVLSTWYRTWQVCEIEPSNCGDFMIETHVSRLAGGTVADHLLHVKSWEEVQYVFPTPVKLTGEGEFALLKDGSTLTGINSTTLSALWTINVDGEPVAVLAGGGAVIQAADGSVVAIDRDGATTSLGLLPVAAPSQVGAGLWMGFDVAGNLSALNGPSLIEASYSFMAQGGNRQGSNAGRRPTIVTLVPSYTLTIPPDVYLPQDLESDLKRRDFAPAANMVFYNPEGSTLKAFKEELAKAQDAVGFIGHSVQHPQTGASLGLRLIDAAIVKKTPDPQYGLPGALNEIVDVIDSNAKVVFIAACELGPLFLSLWNIDDNTTDRALIVPVGSETNTDLFAATIAWKEIVRSLINDRKTVSDAVTSGNFLLQLNGVPASRLRFRVIGGQSVRIR